MVYIGDMTRAAELRTETPDLQALFDQDWSSGKYRRPKCSKSDFYAGWLVAYERFQSIATVEKVSVVEKPQTLYSDSYTGPRWTYGMTHRPTGIGCQPTGRIIGADDPKAQPDPRVLFGTIQYARELTREEIEGYELLPVVATVEKVSVVEKPAPKVEPEHVTGWTPARSQSWLEGVTFMDPKSEHGHKHILCGFKDRFLRLTEYNSAEWTIERKNPNAKHDWLSWDALPNYKPLPLKTARVVAARELKGAPMPEKTVTHYSGSLPLKHEAPKGPAPFDGCNESQAIPDSLLRKLAIKAGRPKIAP